MPTHGHPGVWIERGPDGRPLMLRHPGNPFKKPWPQGKTVFELALEYVVAYRADFGLNPDHIAGLNDGPLQQWRPNRRDEVPPGATLRWLPVDSKDFRRSYVVRRNPERGSRDESGVLLAGLSSNGQVFLRQDALRLRVVFHASGEGSGREIRFTGMSRNHGEADADELYDPTFRSPKAPNPRNAVDVKGEVLPLDPPSEGGSGTIAARRTNRYSAAFKPAQKKMSLGPLQVSANSAALETSTVDVLDSFFVPGDQPVPPRTKRVAVQKVGADWETTQTDARTNEFAAINAFFHTRQLVERLVAAGLDPTAYFRCAQLPIWVAYRSGIARHPDGRARNADTVWGKRPALDASPAVPGEILLRYALGDLSISPGKFPLGIACDVRWHCHEFGHVLLMASVGEREFRFAHSAGDSMAAILTDPDSDLALPQHDGGWRGVTFPWVALNRRHDRSPANGWAWGGPVDRNEHGYWKEQILSSTLFRLYQTLGGDATTNSGAADAQTRKAASDHTLFLIMHAIGLMGAADLVPVSTPDQFVSALMDADVGTAKFVTTNGRERIGGNAHKVVRWAFERQGLYPAAATERPVRVPGDAPAVDVYIASSSNGTYSWQLPTYQILVNNPQQNASNVVQVTVGNRGANAAVATTVTLWEAGPNAGTPDWGVGWVKGPEQTLTIPARSPGVPVQLTWRPAKRGHYALLAVASCEEDRANTNPATGLPCATRSPIPQLLLGDNNLGLIETKVT